MNSRKSILAKFVVLLLLVVGGTIGSALWFMSNSQKVFYDTLYQNNAISFASSLDAAFNTEDFNDKVISQEHLYKFQLGNPGILEAVLYTNELGELKVFASTNLSEVGRKAEEDDLKVFTTGIPISFETSYNEQIGQATVIPARSNGQIIGLYEIVLSKGNTAQSLRNQLLLLSSIVIIATLILIILMILILRFNFIKPLQRIIKGIELIGKGQFTPLPVSSHDEFGSLTEAFNGMGKEISLSRSSLEEKVMEKTKELNEKATLFEKQNIDLEKNKAAMINLLEDAKKLEDDLKNEKAGVELKVKKRTEELAQEKSKLDSSIQNLPIGFMMANVQAEVVVCNSIAEKIIGTTNHHQAFETLKAILSKQIDIVEYIRQCGVNKERRIFENIDLESKVLRILLSPILVREAKEECIGIVILLEDVTEAKVLERSKDEFFSIASHELRTPLTAIRGNTSMVLEYYADALSDPALKEMISDVHESSINLINIVNDFLNVSRFEQKRIKFNIKPFDIGSLIELSLKEYEVTGSRQKLHLLFEEPKTPLPQVLADPDRVREILVNLIGNSLKFTEEGGVTVRTALAGNMLEISVEDTGRGISVPNQSLLFHKFQQAGSSLFTRDTTRGTGLGLYISKMMVEGMGGTIRLVKSEEGKGSTFAFTLPLATK